MSEPWAITLLGIVLSWVAYEIRGIRSDMKAFVKTRDCERDMCTHYSEIQNLWKNVRELALKIAKIEK